mmetsp:Transcript_10613/g.25197  ORF Transcript_10613/g.25197 Transcript_10613/m.25197 type:complete len:453 (+) Transcript_10613:81-1439(+)
MFTPSQTQSRSDNPNWTFKATPGVGIFSHFPNRHGDCPSPGWPLRLNLNERHGFRPQSQLCQTPQLNVDHHQIHEVQDLEAVVGGEEVGHVGVAVGDEELVEGPAVGGGEAVPSAREDGVGDEGRDRERALLFKGYAALVQSPPGLHEIVDDDNVLPLRVAVLDVHDPLVSVPDLATDDNLPVRKRFRDQPCKALARPLVRESNAVDLAVGLVEFGDEEGHGGVEGGQRVPGEVEAVLQRVEVVDHDADRLAYAGEVREEASESVSSGDLALAHHALHRARRIVREDHRETLEESLAQHVQDMELGEGGVVVVEGGEEDNVRVLDVVVGVEPANFDVVGTIRELAPFRVVEDKALWVLLHHLFRRSLLLRVSEDLILEETDDLVAFVGRHCDQVCGGALVCQELVPLVWWAFAHRVSCLCLYLRCSSTVNFAGTGNQQVFNKDVEPRLRTRS